MCKAKTTYLIVPLVISFAEWYSHRCVSIFFFFNTNERDQEYNQQAVKFGKKPHVIKEYTLKSTKILQNVLENNKSLAKGNENFQKKKNLSKKKLKK
jgi:hypothetical protein